MKKPRKTVFVAMSGGVDSSVAAALLKKQGFNVVGVFMKCWSADSCLSKDLEDAQKVANVLKIPFYVFDFEKEYKNKVVDYMIDGYQQGITPNPDVMCNKEIKFGLFLKKALEMGADYIATGHYVRARRHLPVRTDGSPTPAVGDHLRSRHGDSPLTLRDQARRASESFSSKDADGQYSLFQAKDVNKDQSYFLWTLTQEQLKYCLFPVGDYLKSEVREMAKKEGLPTADKKDSQGICFLGKVTLRDFLSQYIPEKRGIVLTTSGKKIGEHQGVYFYTIGQRHGLSIAGDKPYYIAEKDPENNVIRIAEGEDNPALYKKEIELTNINFINPQLIKNKPLQVLARVRYRQPLAKVCFRLHDLGFKLIFDEPIKFVAPGQSAVFYKKNGEMLGGGIIKGFV